MRTSKLLAIACLALLASCHACSRPRGEVAREAEVATLAPAASSADARDREGPAPRANVEPPFKDGKRTFDTVKETLLKRYDATDLDDEALYRAAVRGMVEYAGRPKSKYDELLTPSDVETVRAELGAEIAGLGYHYDFDEERGQVILNGVVPGTPAEKAGLRAGDIILKQGGRSIKTMTRAEFSATRGAVGEPVDLVVLRDEEIVKLTITRALVTFDDVLTITFGDVAYVRIGGFSLKTAATVRAALAPLAAANPAARPRGLVVDLRDNSGGAFDGAIATAGVFLDAGTTVGFLVARGKEEKLVATGGPVLGVPITVLVDDETAAGAELVAAALSDARHSKIVGTRTLGKWSVQNMDRLPNGYAIKYAAAHMLTASRRSFEGHGLTPDVETRKAPDVSMVYGVTDPDKRLAADPTLRTAIELLRAH